MNSTLIKVGWLTLKRSPVELVLVFVVPIAFFSIFALIFGGTTSSTARVAVAVVDEAGTETSVRLVKALAAESSLKVTTQSAEATSTPLDRAGALDLVKRGKVPVAVIIPKGFSLGFDSSAQDRIPLDLLVDSSDAIAPQIVAGLLQKTVMTSAPDLMIRSGIGQFEKYAGGLTESQRKAFDSWIGPLETSMKADPSGANSQEAGFSGLVAVKTTDVVGKDKKNPVVAFYVAAIAVMFLLFSASGGGGVLLEEEANGTLDRLLTMPITMKDIVISKWAFLSLIGVLQITCMFIWANLVFSVEFYDRLPGFFVMTACTAMAASGFGLLLASICRSQAQLSAASTIVILMMSALGGSMFPRIFMSETMQKIGLVTFNAWAIDGYQKVFWRRAPFSDLWPQVLVLLTLCVLFLVVSLRLARRFERG